MTAPRIMHMPFLSVLMVGKTCDEHDDVIQTLRQENPSMKLQEISTIPDSRKPESMKHVLESDAVIIAESSYTKLGPAHHNWVNHLRLSKMPTIIYQLDNPVIKKPWAPTNTIKWDRSLKVWGIRKAGIIASLFSHTLQELLAVDLVGQNIEEMACLKQEYACLSAKALQSKKEISDVVDQRVDRRQEVIEYYKFRKRCFSLGGIY